MAWVKGEEAREQGYGREDRQLYGAEERTSLLSVGVRIDWVTRAFLLHFFQLLAR